MKKENTTSERSGLSRVGRGLVREILVPIGVMIGLLLIAVALVEGQALDQFLYAVF